MIKTSKLKGKIVESGLGISQIAEKLGINVSTLYRKISNGGQNFTIKEAQQLAELLHLTGAEVNEIFFNITVA